jgi:hypothetical protein
MLQRIQTLYLLGAAVFTILMLVMPLAEILTEEGIVYTGTSRGLLENGELVVATLPVTILVVVTGLLLLISILLFRNRKLQIRLCVYAIILEFGLMGLMYYFWVVILRQLQVDSYLIKVAVVFPALSIILVYLAFRGIRRDEILIRSIDKIR